MMKTNNFKNQTIQINKTHKVYYRKIQNIMKQKKKEQCKKFLA